MRLRRGAELLDEQPWQAECTGSALEDSSARRTGLCPSLSEDLSRFGRPLFIIGISREGPHGDRYFDYQAIGLGCRDTLAASKVLETSSLLRYSWPRPFTEKEARPQAPKARWRSLQWYLEGANANPMSEKRGVELETKWDQEGCHLTLRGEEAP